MANQTKVEQGDGEPAKEGGAPGGASRLMRDIVELGELQMRLLMLDAQASSAHVRAAVVRGVLAAALVLSALEMALLWVAAALVEWAGWPWVAGLGVATGLGVLLAVIPLVASLLHWQRGMSAWRRSQGEFDKNMAWFKGALGASGGSLRPPPPDRPSPK